MSLIYAFILKELKMELKVDKLIVILLLFFGSNVLGAFNIRIMTFQAFILAISILPLLVHLKDTIKIKSLTFLLCFVLIFAVYKLYTDRGEGTRNVVLSIIGAPMLIAALPNPIYNNRSNYMFFWKKILLIVFCAYIVETGLGVLERLIGRNVFGYKSDILLLELVGGMEYRSTALYGHPLSNALMVSVAMAFILVSNLKSSIKIPLWLLGFLSILCFNTRSSIVGNLLLLFAYVGYTFVQRKKMKTTSKMALAVGSIISVFVIYIVVFYFSWGGRLLNMGLFDDSSAQTRIDAWDLFNYYDYRSFIWGHTFKENMMIRYEAGLYHLENPWLGYMLSCGFVFLLIYFVAYFFVFKYYLRDYILFDKLYLAGAFLLIASTNNALEDDFIFLFYFLLLCIVFNPKIFKRIVKRKYLV